MNNNNDPFVTAMAGCLTRTQQMLLELGYAYVAGDSAAWPMTFIEMQKRDSVLLVGPMSPNNCQNIAVAWRNIASQCPAAGLLVAGVVPVDHPAVEWLFQNTKGAVAYMDAARAQFRVRRPSAILTEAPLPIHDKYVSQFVNPAALSHAAASIDCRARMAHDLTESLLTQEFQDQAQRLSGKPVMTYALMGICIAIYAVMYAPNWLASNPPTELLVRWGALFGPLVKDGQWWRLITNAFIHIGFIHLLFNMMAFFYFGQPLELFQGKWRLVVFFLFSALVGGVTVLFWSPTIPCAGASG
ncbi:MAG: rhomboid family intramembrane serine protease, partial [Planctomycetaceae bacterium]